MNRLYAKLLGLLLCSCGVSYSSPSLMQNIGLWLLEHILLAALFRGAAYCLRVAPFWTVIGIVARSARSIQRAHCNYCIWNSISI